jgi:hypothetical protein
MNANTHAKDALLKLVSAKSDLEVTEIIQKHPFFKDCVWDFYGNLQNNAGIIKAQSPDPIGALVEKITNGIDAILVRKCWENNIDPLGEVAPKSQIQAINMLFGEKITEFKLTDSEIRDIAAKTVRIFAEGDADKPTLTVVDYGEGQRPSAFQETFLSIGRTNKIKMHFVQGVYNQGGSAALKFCGNGYQLIMSRRAPKIPGGDDEDWGFTLVRERYEAGSTAEQYEYCMVNEHGKNVIPHFPYEVLNVIPNGKPMENGTLIRLYSYILKNPNLFITGQRERELAREINKRYFSMPLPIELNELRTHLKGWSTHNEKTRIYGLWRLLKKQLDKSKEVIRTKLVLKSELGVFGARIIEIIILNDEGDVGESYKSQNEKVFLTVNGQAQHTETVNFLKTECLLPDLAPYMIVHVDLSNAGYQANKIFHTDRYGVISLPEYVEFRDRLIKSIKDDDNLIELDKEYKERKLKNVQPEDKELSRYIQKLVQNNTSLMPYFQMGLDMNIKKSGTGQEKFIGKQIPTFLEIVGASLKNVPCNRYCWLKLKTDAVNDYLMRDKDNGTFNWNPSGIVQLNQYSLRNGIIPIRIEPQKETKIGETDEIIFELTRPGLPSLKAGIKVIIGQAEEPHNSPPGKPRKPKTTSLKLPKRELVQKTDWPSRNWNEFDIAEINESHDGITVYINKEPEVLTEFPINNPRFNSGEMIEAVRKKFYATAYLYALAMYFEMGKNAEDKLKRDWAIPASLKAISKFTLDLAFAPERRRNTLD